MAFALLITPEMMNTIPKDVEILQNFGETTAVFPNEKGEITNKITGDHCVVQAKDDNLEVLKDWLRPFDGVAVTQGNPQLEQFEIMHIK